MAKEGIAGDLIVLRIKETTFHLHEKNRQLNEYVWEQPQLFKYAKGILDDLWPVKPTRLMGIRVSNLKKVEDIKKDMKIDKIFMPVSKNQHVEQTMQRNNQIIQQQEEKKFQPVAKYTNSKLATKNKRRSQSARQKEINSLKKQKGILGFCETGYKAVRKNQEQIQKLNMSIRSKKTKLEDDLEAP